MTKKKKPFSGYGYHYQTDDGVGKIVWVDKNGLPTHIATCRTKNSENEVDDTAIQCLYVPGKIIPQGSNKHLSAHVVGVINPDSHAEIIDLRTGEQADAERTSATGMMNALLESGTSKQWNELFREIKKIAKPRVSELSYRA